VNGVGIPATGQIRNTNLKKTSRVLVAQNLQQHGYAPATGIGMLAAGWRRPRPIIFNFTHALLAQLVERLHGKEEVIGSIPVKGSKNIQKEAVMTLEEATAIPYPMRVFLFSDDWVAEFYDLPGCIGVGDNPEEAVSEALIMKPLWLESAMSIGRPIPEPTVFPGWEE
jgi:predicted RNase H-like HicB family nuclease